MKVVILAGGSGTRLWPASRISAPKQLLSLFGGDTLLTQTYKRLRRGFSPADILVATGQNQARAVRRQLPDLPRVNLLAEPVRRDSAGAIGLAAALLYKINPAEVLISVHADHWVSDDKKYVAVLKAAGRLAEKHSNHMIMVGLKPSYPETGLGYIQVSKRIAQAYVVSRFIEKPNLKRARAFVKAGKYFWDAGWFAWRVDHLWNLYKKHLPKSFAVLNKIASTPPARWQRVVNREFPKLRAVAVDYGITEKTKKILMLPANIDWTDIGHWRSVHEMSAKDTAGNAATGPSILLDSANNLLFTLSKKLVAAVGVSNLVLVETPDAILLIDRRRAQEVKRVINELKSKKQWQRYL